MGYTLFRSSDEKYLIDSNQYRFFVKTPHLSSDIDNDYYNSLKSNSIKPIFQLYYLYEDETIREDLSPYLIDGGELSIVNQSGLRRKLSVEIKNEKAEWSPNPVYGFLWKGCKFKLYTGFKTAVAEYIRPAGVFVLSDFDVSGKYKEGVYSLRMVDKFGELDGTVGGSIIDGYCIARDSNIYDVICSLLGNNENIFFPSELKKETTPYTLSYAMGSSETKGSIIKTLAQMVNLDVYCDEYGNYIFEECSDSVVVNSKAPIWTFSKDDLEYVEPTYKIDFQKVYNIVVVEGANLNGNIVTATAKNENAKSPTNISVFKETPLYITDENISSEDSAKKRAEYELYKNSLLPISVDFSSVLIPHLDVNQVVQINDDRFDFPYDRYLINSINIPISGTCKTTLNVTNIREAAY